MGKLGSIEIKETEIKKIELTIQKMDGTKIFQTIQPKENARDAHPLRMLQEVISLWQYESNLIAPETLSAPKNRIDAIKKDIVHDKYIAKDKSLDGNILQIKLFMMFSRNASDKNFEFFSGKQTNLVENLHYFAIKKDAIYQFLHIAYSVDSDDKITVNDLGKYFIFFSGFIKKNLFKTNNGGDLDHIKAFTVITNNDIDITDDWNEPKLLTAKFDEFLYMGDGSKIWTFKKDNFDQIKNKIRASIDDHYDDLDKRIETFLEKIQFITKYPSEVDIDSWIEKRESFYFIDANLMSNSVNESWSDSFDYFSNRYTAFLTPQNTEVLLENMKRTFNSLIIDGLNGDHLKNLDDFGISFERENLENLGLALAKRFQKNVIKPILLSTKCTELSVIKFFELCASSDFIDKFEEKLQVENIIFLQSKKFLRQKIQNFVEKTFLSDSGPNVLVIECESISQDEFDHIHNLTTKWKIQSKKDIILIIDDQYYLYQKDIDQIEDEEICFKHLTPETQDAILEMDVSYQGSVTKLNELLDRIKACDLIDSKCLWQIVSNNRLEV